MSPVLNAPQRLNLFAKTMTRDLLRASMGFETPTLSSKQLDGLVALASLEDAIKSLPEMLVTFLKSAATTFLMKSKTAFKALLGILLAILKSTAVTLWAELKYVSKGLGRLLVMCIKWAMGTLWRGLGTLWRLSRIQELLGWGLTKVLFLLKTSVIATAMIVAVVAGVWILRVGGRCVVNLIVSELERRQEERDELLREQRVAEDRVAQEALERELQECLAAEETARREREAQQQRVKKDREAERVAASERLRREETTSKQRDKEHYINWKKECVRTFAAPNTMDRFPSPPVARCTHSACVAFTETNVCRHNLEVLFRNSGILPSQVKKELKFFHMKYFHPDRFEKCNESVRGDFKGRADAVFKMVLGPWYEELERKEQLGK